MANFEGKLNLNVETSEIEIKGKFKLTEDELDTVAGGQGIKDAIPYSELVEGQSVWAYDSDLGEFRWGTVVGVWDEIITVKFGGGTAITEDGPKALTEHEEKVQYVYGSSREMY